MESTPPSHDVIHFRVCIFSKAINFIKVGPARSSVLAYRPDLTNFSEEESQEISQGKKKYKIIE